VFEVIDASKGQEAAMTYGATEKYEYLQDDQIADYSEEAVPERDPAYRRPAGTLCDPETAEYVPLEERRALAQRLEELGMSPAKVAFVARL
jgi:hypothetical protein